MTDTIPKRPKTMNLDEFKQSLGNFLGADNADHLSSAQDQWRPATDIRENRHQFLLEIELPGIERDQIEITLKDKELSIHCERSDKPSKDCLIRRERHLGSFARHFCLPTDACPEKISARFSNGVLFINVPRRGATDREHILIR